MRCFYSGYAVLLRAPFFPVNLKLFCRELGVAQKNNAAAKNNTFFNQLRLPDIRKFS